MECMHKALLPNQLLRCWLLETKQILMAPCDHPHCHLQKKGEIRGFVLFCCCSLWQDSGCLVAKKQQWQQPPFSSFHIYKIYWVDSVYLALFCLPQILC